MTLLTMALLTVALLTMWHLNSLEDVDPYGLLTEDLAQSTRGKAVTHGGSAALQMDAWAPSQRGSSVVRVVVCHVLARRGARLRHRG